MAAQLEENDEVFSAWSGLFSSELGSLKSAKYTCKFQIHVLQRVAVAVRLEEDLCGKLGEGSLGASGSVAHHLDERYEPLYRGNATREFAT